MTTDARWLTNKTKNEWESNEWTNECETVDTNESKQMNTLIVNEWGYCWNEWVKNEWGKI